MAGTLTLEELEKYAESFLSKEAFSYYANGTGAGITLRENRAAFTRWKIIPRCFRGINCLNVDTSLTILGERIATPVCASPTGLHKVGNEDGELATVRGCYAAGTCMAVSAYATYSYEEIADACPDALKWCQMYLFKDRELTLKFVRRAELSGYKALMITVDTNPVRKRIDFRDSLNLSGGVTTANFPDNPGMALKWKIDRVNGLIEPCLGWKDVDWLKSVTKLPIVLKGILSADDAKEAVKHGVEGILVSNKGGRKLDVLPSTLDVLPTIAKAVDGKAEVYLDGGIRNGTDVFKALALGARAVFVGRPVIWGLVRNGSQGVQHVFETMTDELKFVMANAGCGRLSDIDESYLMRHFVCNCNL